MRSFKKENYREVKYPPLKLTEAAQESNLSMMKTDMQSVIRKGVGTLTNDMLTHKYFFS